MEIVLALLIVFGLLGMFPAGFALVHYVWTRTPEGEIARRLWDVTHD